MNMINNNGLEIFEPEKMLEQNLNILKEIINEARISIQLSLFQHRSHVIMLFVCLFNMVGQN